jgi:S1-C subfamily serine protease
MRRLICLAIFSSLSTMVFAQGEAALYSAISNSVVYLKHEISLRSTDCRRPDLIRRYEKLANRPLLDTELLLASGSGFFLDSDGTILTNRHVANIGDLPMLRARWVRFLDDNLDKDFAAQFSEDERMAMKKDFLEMLAKGRYAFKAMLGNRDLGEVSLLAVAAQNEPDLAVGRAAGGPYTAIRLAPAAAIGPGLVGTEVLSFGYPMADQLDAMFHERTVTMSQGTISAFRNAELSLQHTAPISHGSSGGPLLNAEGLVVGVNTYGLQEKEGNSLFYAIDALRILDFLRGKGFGSTVLSNQRLAAAVVSSGPRVNPAGEVESSPEVVLEVDADVEVLLDGTRIGTGPTTLRLVNPVSRLELSGPKGVFSARLRLVSALSGPTTLHPTLSPRQVSVRMDSTPAGAKVIANGVTLGMTPLNIVLAEGTYRVQLRQDGQWYEDDTIEVRKDRSNGFTFSGTRAGRVVIQGLPPTSGITLHFDSSLGSATFLGGEPVNLPKGSWTLKLDGSEDYAGVSVPFEVSGRPFTLDLAPYNKRKALLRIIGLEPKARVWIDEKPVSASTDTLQVTMGDHNVFVWEDGLEPLDKAGITVGGDNKSSIVWGRNLGHDAKGSILLWSGVGTGALGVTLLGIGLISDSAPASQGQTSFSGYLYVSGGALLLGTGILEWFAHVEQERYESQRKYMDSLQRQ